MCYENVIKHCANPIHAQNVNKELNLLGQKSEVCFRRASHHHSVEFEIIPDLLFQKLQEEAHTGRRLLQTASDTMTSGFFYNMSYIGPNNGSSTLFAYLKSIWVCMYSSWDRNHQPEFCPYNFTLSQFKAEDFSVEWNDNSSVM